ncbi:MAG: nucleotidyl transferase AbiEii/AbiGii toxin family protein [Cytophagales bacterium]|nr:nucleotidyl transferase AbiEii/AbiGii toxin family protein [Cytophagales bacterium]
MKTLYYNTINELLKKSLLIVMNTPIFDSFRLVGGTALSLQMGHRESIDIDLFSDINYGDIDFGQIDYFLRQRFNYVATTTMAPAFGKAYFIGEDKEHTVKLDVFYTDPFIQTYVEIDTIRMASIEEIIAMKMDVIQRGGRKKDFWDLHELLQCFSIPQMINLHERRYPYSHDKATIIKNLIHFDYADNDLNPICLKGKYWEFIKDDFQEIISELNLT